MAQMNKIFVGRINSLSVFLWYLLIIGGIYCNTRSILEIWKAMLGKLFSELLKDAA